MKAVRQINVKDFDLDQVQTNTVAAIRDIQSKVIVDGNFLKDIAIGITETPVAHKLQRMPLGYFIIGKDGVGDIYGSEFDGLNIYLTSTVAVNCNIWVF